MKLTLRDRFLRLCDDRSPRERAAVFERLIALRREVANPHMHSGAGFRKLHPTQLYELRVGLDLRVVFDIVGDEVNVLFLGTHDEVKRFVRASKES